MLILICSSPTTGGGNTVRSPAQGAATGRPRARTRTTATSVSITLHTATRRESASPGASRSRETEQPPRTKHFRWCSGGMIFLQDDESKQQFMVDTGAVCSFLPHRSKTSQIGPQLSGADGKAIPCFGECPPLNVRAEHIFRPLFARCRLQTHTWFRFLVRPWAAGRPSRPPSAGLENSKTAVQSKNRRRDPALQIRRRPLLHSTDGTVLVSFVPSHRRRRERKTIAKTQDSPHNRDNGPSCIRQGPPPWPGQAAPGRNRVP